PVTEVAWRTPPTLSGTGSPVAPPSTPVLHPTAPQPMAAPAPSAREPSWPLAPLVWFNRAFDGFLRPLGPAGRWLRRPAGRNLLGLLGLLGLSAAAALALADGLGWGW